jgi:hypothetical protein
VPGLVKLKYFLAVVVGSRIKLLHMRMLVMMALISATSVPVNVVASNLSFELSLSLVGLLSAPFLHALCQSV